MFETLINVSTYISILNFIKNKQIKLMTILTQIFIIYCTIFLLYMYFKWAMVTLLDSIIKISIFLVAMIGILLELKHFNII